MITKIKNTAANATCSALRNDCVALVSKNIVLIVAAFYKSLYPTMICKLLVTEIKKITATEGHIVGF